MTMNRILLITAAITATFILSFVVFVVFFQYDGAPRARALVVITPTSVMGATAINTVTQTVSVLATTDVFRAFFINDLTLSGTIFSPEDIAQVHVYPETSGLISVSVTNDDIEHAQRIATSGAYSIVRIIQEYYDTMSVYTFSVIDGSALPMPTYIPRVFGIIISALIGSLFTALIFVIVFSVRSRKIDIPSVRPHGNVHASNARLDLKLSETQTPAPTHDDTDASDYMRDIYKDYDASLEELTEVELPEVPTQNENAIATQTIQERIKNTTNKEESTLPTEKIPPEEKVMQKPASRDLAKPTPKPVQKHSSKKQDTINALSVLGKLFKNKKKELAKKEVSKKEEEQLTAKKTSAPVIATHAAPANLPVMDAPTKDSPMQKSAEQSTDTDQQKDPTPAEVRKRLNELLSGKPPKISSN